MSKNNKGFANIALIVVVIVAAAAAYLLFFKERCVLESPPDLYVCGSNFSHFMNSFRNPVTVNPAQIPDTSGGSNKIDWNSLLPQIRTILVNKTKPSSGEPRANDPITVSSSSNITGEGETMVGIPWGGGAASWQVAVIRIENGQPILAQMKGKDGKISDAILLDAGSAGYAMSAVLDLAYKAIVYVSYSQQDNLNNPNPSWPYAGGYSNCGTDVYTWNSSTKIFEWNQTLSNQLQNQYCTKATSQNTP